MPFFLKNLQQQRIIAASRSTALAPFAPKSLHDFRRYLEAFFGALGQTRGQMLGSAELMSPLNLLPVGSVRRPSKVGEDWISCFPSSTNAEYCHAADFTTATQKYLFRFKAPTRAASELLNSFQRPVHGPSGRNTGAERAEKALREAKSVFS